MEQDIEFGRCVEFLVRMIEKYGDALLTDQPGTWKNMTGNGGVQPREEKEG